MCCEASGGNRIKNLLTLFLLSLLALLVCTCDPENDNPGLVYPLAVGNTWEYSRQTDLFFYQDSSETPVYEDTTMYTTSISITITGREPIQENLRAYAFCSVETDSLDTYTGTHYYNNTGEGLLMHAYSGWGSLALPKRRTDGRIRFKGRTFASLQDLSNYIQYALPVARFQSDSLYIEDPPVMVLQYPLEVGASWTFRNAEDPWRIDKIVLAKEDIQVPAGEFSCYKIQWLYDLDRDEQWDENIALFDYIGSAGLVRRRITVIGVIMTDENTNEMGYVDMLSEFNLTAVSVE